MQEIADFKQNTVTEVQIQVHGMTNIYHSKRRLVDHYMTYQGRKLQPVRDASKVMYLIEKERPDERFPIIETEHGTHIMSSDDICMLECLDEILPFGTGFLLYRKLAEEYLNIMKRSFACIAKRSMPGVRIGTIMNVKRNGWIRSMSSKIRSGNYLSASCSRN